MNPPEGKTSALYQGHLTLRERKRFTEYGRAPLDHEIALLRVLNERQMARLAASEDPQEQAELSHTLAQVTVLIARLMQIRASLGQDEGDERLDAIAASLRSAFTRPDPPGRLPVPPP